MRKLYHLKMYGLLIGMALYSLSACKKDNPAHSLNANQSANVPVTATPISNPVAASGSIQKLLSGSALQLGIVGHPLGDEPYLKVSATTQIDLIKSMGMSWYRIGVLVTADGSVTVPRVLDPLLAAAAAGKVNLLPMLYLRTMSFGDSETVAYQKGKKLGADFAAKYGKYFSFYNLGNDLELDLLLKNKTGQSAADYDPAKFKVTAAYLKGMDEGIKSKDADAKTMIGAGWLHYCFLQMCQSYGIKFDVVAYQWYSDMEDAAPKTIPDITLKLSSLFPEKPIWFTEFNYRYKATSNLAQNENAQKEFVTNFLVKCRNNPQVKVAIMYELFDEPAKSLQESTYGVIKWTSPFTSWANKALADALQVGG
jgi:hypothetical protein